MCDKVGWWEPLSIDVISDLTMEDAEKLELTNLMLQAKLPCTNGELVEWVMKVNHWTSKSPADKLLKKCKGYGILDSKRDGRYSKWFMVTTPESDATEQELPLADN